MSTEYELGVIKYYSIILAETGFVKNRVWYVIYFRSRTFFQEIFNSFFIGTFQLSINIYFTLRIMSPCNN